jgi:hypothetical protein
MGFISPTWRLTTVAILSVDTPTGSNTVAKTGNIFDFGKNLTDGKKHQEAKQTKTEHEPQFIIHFEDAEE